MIGPPRVYRYASLGDLDIAQRPEWVEVLDVNMLTGRHVVWAITYGASVVEGVCGARILYREIPKLLWGLWYRSEKSDAGLGCHESDSTFCDSSSVLVSRWSSFDRVTEGQ